MTISRQWLRDVYRFLAFGGTRKAFREYGRQLKPALAYLITSDVYTLASAISTTAVLSFFPFTILVITVVRHVLRSDAAYGIILQLLREYLPYEQEFITSSIQNMTDHFGSIQFISIVILLVSSMGVFVPVEVTLNRTWNAPANMSFLRNQMVSFGLVLLCGVLALLSFYIGGANLSVVHFLFGWLPFKIVQAFISAVVVKLVGFILSIGIFFAVFYLLPNIRLSWKKTLRASVFTGVCWELGKYLYMWSLPHLDLGAVYGPFTVAVVLIIWSYVSAMIMILGADLAHRDLLSLELFKAAYMQWKADEQTREVSSETDETYDIGSAT